MPAALLFAGQFVCEPMALVVRFRPATAQPIPLSPWLLRNFPRCKKPYRWVIRSFS